VRRLTRKSAERFPTESAIAYRRAADQLRQEILDGVIEPGSWVRMQAIADRLGLSVQPVREALQLLEGEGLVEMLPNRGARVHGLDPVRLGQIYDVREALESYQARRFAEDARPSEIRRLEEIQALHDKAAAAGNAREVGLTNREFHRVINTFGNNPLIIDPVSRYIDFGRMLVRKVGHEPGYLKRVLREHHALLAAFRRHDGTRAADLGAAHVRITREEMLARIQVLSTGKLATRRAVKRDNR
jgi:DNA-binding GntR family transcriptional regulator